MAALDEKLAAELANAEARIQGLRWSIDVRSSSSRARRSFSYSTAAEEPLKTASVGKVFLLTYLAMLLEESDTSHGDKGDTNNGPKSCLWDGLPVLEKKEPIVGDSGLWHLMCSGPPSCLQASRTLCVRDACVMIGAVSDNAATNLLLHYVGLGHSSELSGTNEYQGPCTETAIDLISQNTSEVFAQLGVVECHSFLYDQTRDPRDNSHPETLSRGISSELTRFVLECHGQALKIDSSNPNLRFLAYLPQWLQNNTDLSMVASAFLLDPLAHQSYPHNSCALGPKGAVRSKNPLPANGVAYFFNKTGTDDGIRADIGVIVLENVGDSMHETVAYSVICNWDSTTSGAHELAIILKCMRLVGEFIFKG